MTVANEGLPAALEVSAIMRGVEVGGGFATVVRVGDPDRGMVVLIVLSRGAPVALLDRERSVDGDLVWRRLPIAVPESSNRIAEFLEKRARFDPDFWVLELDVALPERFIEEMMVKG